MSYQLEVEQHRANDPDEESILVVKNLDSRYWRSNIDCTYLSGFVHPKRYDYVNCETF